MLPFMFFAYSKSGPAWDSLRRIKKSGAFGFGKIHIRQSGSDPTHLLIGIGQMHPVLQGRFERFQAARIAHIQTWIFRLCVRLASDEGVRAFGEEGFGASVRSSEEFRVAADALQKLRPELASCGSPGKFLRWTAQRWRRALQRGDGDEAQRLLLPLNALTILQMMDENVHLFPLEQTDVHGAVGTGVDILQEKIFAIERSPAYQAARTRSNAVPFAQQKAAVDERNDLVSAFNRLLSDPARDQWIFAAATERARLAPVTAFVLGQGHRSGMLTLAKEHLPEDVLFIWVTPPQLWLWQAVLKSIGWGLLLAVTLTLAVLAW